MKKLIIGLLIGTILSAFVLTVTGYIDLRNAIAQVRSSIIELGSLIAGERLQDSATKSYVAIRDEADVTIVGVTTAITLCGGVANDCHLLGLQITTALTGTCVITGFADSAGVATSITFPIGSVGLKDFKGAKNSAGALTITCGTGGDDNFVAVLTRPAI